MTGSTLSIPELFHHAGLPEGHSLFSAYDDAIHMTYERGFFILYMLSYFSW